MWRDSKKEGERSHVRETKPVLSLYKRVRAYVRIYVYVRGRFGLKAFIANVTLEGFFSCMNKQVTLEMLF